MTPHNIQTTIQTLMAKYPHARTELVYQTPFQLLVAGILAAQCLDSLVNSVTKDFFKSYPDAAHVAKLTPEQLMTHLGKVSFAGAKCNYVSKTAKAIHEKFHDNVPETLDDLTTLSGVGRKTAHLVMSHCFGQPVIAVDTHVFRVSNRLGLVKAKDVLETEMQLMKIIPTKDVVDFTNALTLHGRYVCKAKSPACPKCELTDVCVFYKESVKK